MLKEIGELPDFIVGHDLVMVVLMVVAWVMGDIVQLMMSKFIVWHKSCWNTINNQKVGKARKKHLEPISPVKAQCISE